MRRILAVSSLFVLALALFGQTQSPPDTFESYVVAADQAQASDAGAEILAAGGNAADAAGATMLVLGLVGSVSSGLGGGGFALYYRASDQTLHYIDFRERAPAASTVDMFARQPTDDDQTAARRSQIGGLSVGVPGEAAGIDALIARFGSHHVTRRQIVAPALRLAVDGYPATHEVSGGSRATAAELRLDPVFGRLFPTGDDAIPEGATLTNPAHARTLREFAARGAAGFYRGAIAREIVRRVRSQGGIITMQDLASYRVADREPLVAERFGYRWASAPPPSAGAYTIFSSLALLERWLPDAQRHRDSALFRHALAESWKGPYTDRTEYLGDPDHVDVPLAALLAPERTEARARIFHPTLAQPTALWDLPLPGRAAPTTQPGNEGGTSHLCVVDREGNVAAVTTTINLSFGARFTAAGVFMNDEMDDFAREVGQRNAFGLVGGANNVPGPGRRPVSSMSPTIVLDRDGPILCAGAAGGSRIITATEQVALFALLFDDTPAQALARMRVHHQGSPETLSVERGFDPAMRAELEARGHTVTEVERSGVAQLVRIRRENGRVILQAASDPRRGGRPAGR
jgi:gamma-glutamyltranspeptidase/glutathione hydrolase